MLEDEIIDYGIIGLGKMGLLHMSILNSLPKTRLAGICDKSRVIRHFSKNLIGEAEIVTSVEKLSELDLDLIYITTPIPTHFSVLREIFDGNIADHVFVEKTLASNFSQAEMLSDLSRNIQGSTMVGYQKRFSGAFRKAENLISNELLGELESFQAYAYSSDFSDGESEEPEARGGVLRDLGAHAIDLALWFFESFEIESASIEPSKSGANSARFEVSSADQVSGTFDVSWSQPGYRMPEIGFSVLGSKGRLDVKEGMVKLEENSETSIWHEPELWEAPSYLLGSPEYSLEDEYFLEKVRNGEEPMTSFQRASKVDHIIERVESLA